MCKSALVIVGNSYLAEYATQAGARRVETLPTVVDLDKFILKADTKSKGFTIGWIGTPNTAKFITMIKPVLITLCSNRDTRLVLVGSGSIELDGVTAEIRTWSEKTEVSDIMSFDVGVMPLYDRPLERGKCGYKLIQYMACSKPVVASPVGVNSEIVLHGVNGFLAASQDEWLDALRRLRMDKDERESLGKAGRRLVEDRYCLQVTAPRLLELLREAAFA